MKKITVYEKNDIKILESHLTDGHSPCCECDSITRMACCGCPEARSYNEKHKEVKEAGIVNLMRVAIIGSLIWLIFIIRKSITETEKK